MSKNKGFAMIFHSELDKRDFQSLCVSLLLEYKKSVGETVDIKQLQDTFGLSKSAAYRRAKAHNRTSGKSVGISGKMVGKEIESEPSESSDSGKVVGKKWESGGKSTSKKKGKPSTSEPLYKEKIKISPLRGERDLISSQLSNRARETSGPPPALGPVGPSAPPLLPGVVFEAIGRKWRITSIHGDIFSCTSSDGLIKEFRRQFVQEAINRRFLGAT